MPEFKNPKPTADVIIEDNGRVVLIRRTNPPPGWAIPGGFIDDGEPVEAAAVREMLEETGLEVHLDDLLYIYSHPDRDPRHHTITAVYVGHPIGGTLQGGDDAAEARYFAEDELPQEIAFDHRQVLKDYFRYKRTGQKPDPMEQLQAWRRR